MSTPLDRQKSPTVQHLKSYDRAMCEATLGTSRSSPNQSGSYPGSNLVPSGTKDPTSPGALVSRPLAEQHSPEDIKKSLTTFEDPLGLGLETLPTTGHADKMVKRGERKIKLGSLLHSDKLQKQGQTLLVKAELVRAHAIDLPPVGKDSTTGQKANLL